MTWTRGPTIGRGATAEVSLATTAAGEIFAVKSTDLSSSALLRKEECLMVRLSSPYIIRCFGSDITHNGDESLYNLFLEYAGGGSLSDMIREKGGRVDEQRIKFYANQLLLGIEYLHSNGLVHCDIKPQNVLIGGDGLKIADFGCAKSPELYFGAEAFSGTVAYMAPEVARGEEQSFPADVWAFGCTVIEMATGVHPWPEMKDPAAALYRIAFSGDMPEVPVWFSGEARDFLGKCLVREPEKRWTAAELLRHPFLAAAESCGEIGELTRGSPTSVMDRVFWDAVEVSESWENMPATAESPAGRMAALVCGRDRNLEEEGGWVTVRSNEAEECEALDEDFGDLIEAELPLMVEEGIADFNMVVMEDSWSDFCNVDDEITNYFVYSELSVSKIMLMELFLHQHRIFLPPFRPIICCSLILLIFFFSLLFACFKDISFDDDDLIA